MLQGTVAAFSNRQDWEFPIFEIVDDDTGELIILTGTTIIFQISDVDDCPLFGGSTDDGSVTLPDSTSFRIFVPRSRVTGLCQGVYQIGVTIENASQTFQFIIGTVNVLKGVVPA